MTASESTDPASLDAVDDALVGPLFSSRTQLDSFRRELHASGLLEKLAAIRADFAATVSGVTPTGKPYIFGSNARRTSFARLYAALRVLQPKTVVETGVCNGVSSSVMLLALEKNGNGKLYSIDFPEFTGMQSQASEYWSGKGGAVVPEGKMPGWIIPDQFRARWELILGRSQEKLGPLLDRLRTIDFFIHDSEHSYECMSFEFHLAFSHLSEGGALVSDDITWNTAFADFAAEVSRPTFYLGEAVGGLIK
jgi:predicted O-methyltransferase YrrM